MAEEYLFGDSDLAGQRLRVLACAFAASTRRFVAATGNAPRIAVDLGCGPGYTTHMLAEVLDCEQTVGLDNSEHFVNLAKKTTTKKVSFNLHDVTAVPFPGAPCDLIYTRFLLTHQTQPEALIAEWITQLRPGGRLLAEEVDSIDIQNPAFGQYIQIVEAMLSADGYELCVGKKMGLAQPPEGANKHFDDVACVPVTNDLAARMFSMNIQTWKDNTFVRDNYTTKSIQRLEESLVDLAATPTSEKGIEWRLRQLVYEREH